MKYFWVEGCCNSLEENESQISKGWQMADAANLRISVLLLVQDFVYETTFMYVRKCVTLKIISVQLISEITFFVEDLFCNQN